jgi:hypothetical protein
MCNLEDIEARFCVVTGYRGDLSQYPLEKSSGFATDKDKSRDFAEVFTPPHIVDKMLDAVPNLKGSNLDLCAGHGQFTIRLLRKLSQVKGFDAGKYLKAKNFFAELQLESCYKLLWVFGTGINLAIGNALELKKLPRNWKGIWLYVEKAGIWVDITAIVKAEVQVSLNADIGMFPYEEAEEKSFVTMVEGLGEWLNRKAKESKMEIEAEIARLINLPTGWPVVKEWVRRVSTDVEDNWQDVNTPEDIARDMVRCIPDPKNRSRFLVLFNIEILEALVKEGVPVKKITFGSDSALEQAMAEAKYKGLKTVPIGKTFEEMKKALENHVGQYEVVLSNPPYQIMDGGFKASARPIYHEIVMYVIDHLKPQYVCMITPSRWMAGGKGLNDYRVRMLADKHLRLIADFPGNADVFETVCISGGVSYFLWDSNYNGLCTFNDVARDIGEFGDVVVRDNTSVQVLRKVLAKHTGKPFCNQVVLPSKPFGLRTFFNDYVPEGTPGVVQVYTNLKGDIRCTLSQNIVDTHGVLGKWKALTSSANGAGQECDASGAKSVLANVIITKPAEACTETLIVAGAFNTKKEATNYSGYMKTKFYRYMLSLRMITQHITQEKFAWVPDLGSYANSVTDEDLYAYFNLTRNEINHINSTIKEI